MTPSHLESSGGSERCPCGRFHADRRPRRRKPTRSPEFPGRVGDELFNALLAGKTSPSGDGQYEVDYARDCLSPVVVCSGDFTYRRIRRKVRCWKCIKCIWARRNYWGLAGTKMTKEAQEAGRRTWFGTLTLSPEAQEELSLSAMELAGKSDIDWQKTEPVHYWCKRRKRMVSVNAFVCEERYEEMRKVLLKQVQDYWKRLRKEGHKFKYIVCFERHKSGVPHAHFLLHEAAEPIRKARLVAQWPWGFVQAKIVGGRAADSAAPEKAAWYVVKYLTKSRQARVVASRGYAPNKRRAKRSRLRSDRVTNRSATDDRLFGGLESRESDLQPPQAGRSLEAETASHHKNKKPDPRAQQQTNSEAVTLCSEADTLAQEGVIYHASD